METVMYLLGFIVVAISVYTDFKGAKIKNVVTMPAILIGLIVAGINGTFLSSFLGVIVPFALLFIFWKIKGLGAGDIKLLMAIGSLLGLKMLANYSVIIFAFAGIHIILILLTGGGLIQAFSKFFTMISNSIRTRSIVGYEKLSADNKGTFKLGYSIFIGYIVAYILFNIVGIEYLIK